MTIATIEHDTSLVPVSGSTGANLIREAAAVMADCYSLAKAVCNTKMIPKHFQGNPDECAAAMLYGASLGMDPMQSVRQIYVVHGQAALYARAMDALVKGRGHLTWTVSTADDSVTVAGQRRGSQHVEESTWTFDRAKKAGYTNNEKYRTDPQAMLYSKALSEVCRKIAPDVLNGVYAVEELQMERWDGATKAPTANAGSAADRMGAILGKPDAAPEPEPEAPADEPTLLDPRSNLGKRMFATINDAGISDNERLPYIASVIGRDVTSSKEMTEAEASRVIDHLQDALEPTPDELPIGGGES